MASLKTVSFIVGFISSFLMTTLAADKYTDENRPYEFGFNIDGEQHRHEKKDEKGLIMGEFGFITADGVYHVTVYATDEEGRFKILSMKNIRVKPYPAYKQPIGSVRQGHSLDLPTPQQTLPQGSPPKLDTEDIPLKNITIENPARSCSSCSLPTTTTLAPAPVILQPSSPRGANTFENPSSGHPINPQQDKTNYFSNQQNSKNIQNIGSAPGFLTNPQNNIKNFKSVTEQGPGAFPNSQIGNQNQPPPDQGLVAPKQDSPIYSSINTSPQAFSQEPFAPHVNQQAPISRYPGQNLEKPLNYPSGSQSSFPTNVETIQPQGIRPDIQSTRNSNTGERTAKKYDTDLQQTFGSVGTQPNGIPNGEPNFNLGKALPNKPTLISAQMQIVDKNTDIYRRGPGEKEGLPDGLTRDDMSQLLYTFNYTVGFHGHFEEGYRNGAKQGYYFITGRNGVRTRVDYIADEKGFRPKITQEVLDLLSEDVPKPETEKDEKYGLKGYEFKWLYFPVESKGQR